MNDKRSEELNERELDQVQGGLSTSRGTRDQSGTTLSRKDGSNITRPAEKRMEWVHEDE